MSAVQPRVSTSSPPVAASHGNEAPADTETPTKRDRPRYEDLPPWRRIARKALIVFAIVVVSLYALYVIAANVALRTRLVRNAIFKFPERSIEYKSAWTVWPGVVHVEDLHIRVQDSRIEFLIVLDHVNVNLDLPALLNKRLHAKQVTAHGLSFRFRQRIDPNLDPHPVTYALPPIEGFAPVDWIPDHYVPPLTGKDLDQIFTFDIENIDVDGVREVWVEDYRLECDARVKGGFHLAPSRNLEVYPSYIEIMRSNMYVGNDLVFENGKGDIRAQIGWFQPRSSPNEEILNRLTSINAVLDAHIPGGFDFAEHRYLASTGPQFEGGAGALHVDLRVRNGDLAPGTTMSLETKDLAMVLGKRKVTASSLLAFDVKDHEGAPHSLMHFDLTNVNAFLDGAAGKPTLHADLAGAFARSKNLGLAKPFNDLLYSIDVPALQLVDVRTLQQFLPKTSALRLGKGTVTAHVHLDAARANGSAQAKVSAKWNDAFIRFHDTSLAGKVALELAAGNLDLQTMSANLTHTTLDFKDFVLTEGTEKRPAWWGHVELEGAALRPQKKDVLTTDVVLKMRDVRPILRTYAAGDDMPMWVAKLLPMENFNGRARLRINDGIDLDDFRARSDDAAIGMRIHSHGKHTQGKVLVESKGLDVGLEITDDGSSPVLIGAYDWYTGGK